MTGNGSAPNLATGEVVTSFVYRISLGAQNLESLGAAADLLNAIIAMLLVLGSNQIARRVSSTSLY